MITHYDLFAGIGGFSLALEEVFSDEAIRHIFCEWESFPTSVLKKHWPDEEYWGDIADLVADTKRARLERGGQKTTRHDGQFSGTWRDQKQDWTIVTGGFPCQPFSAAGRRKGTEDDRYQWPNMLAVIRYIKPSWVIAENVRGLVTWNKGMVLETVCADLESEGYEVQPFIIPAVAVGAPHRRDRVWIIAYRNSLTGGGRSTPDGVHAGIKRTAGANEDSRQGRQGETGVGQESKSNNESGFATHPGCQRWQPGRSVTGSQNQEVRGEGQRKDERHDIPDWNRSWQEVAFATCDDAVDDGLPRLVDGVSMSRSKWRQNSLKAYGNGIVPQVAMEIMRGIYEA